MQGKTGTGAATPLVCCVCYGACMSGQHNKVSSTTKACIAYTITYTCLHRIHTINHSGCAHPMWCIAACLLHCSSAAAPALLLLVLPDVCNMPACDSHHAPRANIRRNQVYAKFGLPPLRQFCPILTTRMFGAACAVKQVIHGVCEVWCFCYFSRDGGKQGVAAPCLSHIICASCIHVVHTSNSLYTSAQRHIQCHVRLSFRHPAFPCQNMI